MGKNDVKPHIDLESGSSARKKHGKTVLSILKLNVQNTTEQQGSGRFRRSRRLSFWLSFSSSARFWARELLASRKPDHLPSSGPFPSASSNAPHASSRYAFLRIRL